MYHSCVCMTKLHVATVLSIWLSLEAQDGNPDVHSVANGLNFHFVGHAYLFREKSNTVSKLGKQ